MKCKVVQEMLSRYQDGELSSSAKSAVDTHLAQCPACQGELAAQRRLWELLAHDNPIQSPEMFLAVEARLASQRRWTAVFDGFQLPSIGFAAAAAALVALSTWTGVWAGTVHHASDGAEHDRAFLELLNDVPPGMEVVTVLEQIGAEP